jgi:hypothetical protein
MRYNKTERLGVIETDKIVTKDLGWIFREQPIIDVGLDAIIEEVENDEPTGKFIALQIKTGEGNFYNTGKTLAHYVSHIHYNYWLNLSIPIILVAHLPNQDETYWQVINESNFKKNKKQWKIEIPLSQKFSEKSKDRLKKLLSVRNDKKFTIYTGEDSEDEFSLLEDIKCLTEATKSINRITEITKDQTEITLSFTEKIKFFTANGNFINDPQVLSANKGFSNSLIITAKRMENEIEIFSDLYSTGIFAFEKVILRLHFYGISLKDLNIDFEPVKAVIPMTEYALNSFSGVKHTALEMNINSQGFKDAKNQYVEVIDLICTELLTAKTITENLVEKMGEI